ncbi:Alpha/Beta hydrolase protein [Aspergillus bertholletiae]|uniref:Alpha/Beta hydrolase protein n=1 Tax=Aspergillus bertholletiae TaxID=1226010 RepID=A0A5N7B880_9EURO|nr:Alpha/Beta hydrolase protein [Aspergillus bertholletiae]
MEVSGKNPCDVRPFYWKQGLDPQEGHRPALMPNRQEAADGMDITWDVPVTMRDGVKVYVDVFRPTGATGKQPIIFTFSPYGKHGPKTFDIFPGADVPKGWVSKYAVWESIDPVVWTRKGYAVINGDSRGSWGSEGDLEIFSAQESRDGHDCIEWAGTLPWSNGKVGMIGVSYLSIVQWGIAATNPPHLAGFVPWEGFTDFYRDYTHHGGIPETKFLYFTQWSCRCGVNLVEDLIANNKAHPLLDDYHRSKCAFANLAKITTPTYVVADWGDHGMHTRGTLNGFTGISSKEKWLEVHGRKKWRYFFEEESVRRQEAFFQKYLKGEPSEIDGYPKVRLEIRDRAYVGEFRDEKEWPLARTKCVKKYIDTKARALVDTPPTSITIASYNSEVQDDCVHFYLDFDKDTELTGSMNLRLWVSSDGADDMDLFVQLDKIDCENKVTPYVAFSMIDDGPLV